MLVAAAASVPQEQEVPAVISLEQALEIALAESPTVKIADMEVERAEFARKGSYASLFPQISASASYQRTIKKQVMYMGGGDDEEDGGGMSGMMAGILDPIVYHLQKLYAGTGIPYVEYVPPTTTESAGDGGIEQCLHITMRPAISRLSTLHTIFMILSRQSVAMRTDILKHSQRISRRLPTTNFPRTE